MINEWNGYWRFDRSNKETGFGEIVEGMRLKDLHAPIYLSTGNEICTTVNGGDKVDVPLFLSSMTGEIKDSKLTISYELSCQNAIGNTIRELSGTTSVVYTPWMQKKLEPLSIAIPDVAGLATLINSGDDK